MKLQNMKSEGRNKQTMIVLLNPGMLENADLDLGSCFKGKNL